MLRIYWYFPFSHDIESRLAIALIRPEDRLTVHSFATRFSAPVTAQVVRYETLRELPEPLPRSEGTLRWAASRGMIYVQRARLRNLALREHQYDIAHIFSLNYFTDWWVLQRIRRQLPLVSTVHDVIPHQPRVPRSLERLLLEKVYKNAGHIIVAHDYLRRRLVQEFGVAPERIHVIAPAIRTVSGPARSSQHHTVLFFGTFRRNKGLPVMLKAISLLSDVEAVRFRFAGRGVPELEEMVRRAAQSDSRIEPEIRFIPRGRKEELYSMATLVVLPYTSFASQSGVLGDAYAHRVPVVVTDVGALGEAVREDRTGWVVPPGDSEALAQTIRNALDNPELRKRASDAAKQVSEKRSIDAVGRKLRELYDVVVAER